MKVTYRSVELPHRQKKNKATCSKCVTYLRMQAHDTHSSDLYFCVADVQ